MGILAHVGETIVFRGHNNFPPAHLTKESIDGWAEVKANGKPAVTHCLESVGGQGDRCSVQALKAGTTYVVAIGQDQDGDSATSDPYAVVVVDPDDEPTAAQQKLLDEKAELVTQISVTADTE